MATHIQPFSGLLDVNLIITAKRYNQEILNKKPATNKSSYHHPATAEAVYSRCCWTLVTSNNKI
jgi:hypothetical protein